MKTKLIKIGDTYKLVSVSGHENQLIGTSDLDYQKILFDRCKKLSKKNCDEIFGVVDVEKLALDEAKKLAEGKWSPPSEEIYLEMMADDAKLIAHGFNKAMELNKDKVFNFEDMIKARNYGERHGEILWNEFIQSLQQPTEIEVEIEREDAFIYEPGDVNVLGSYSKKINPKAGEPRVDSDECLILKKV